MNNEYEYAIIQCSDPSETLEKITTGKYDIENPIHCITASAVLKKEDLLHPILSINLSKYTKNGEYFILLSYETNSRKILPAFIFSRDEPKEQIEERFRSIILDEDIDEPSIPTRDTELNQELPNGAVRANLDKPRLALIPPAPLEEIGKVFTYGAKKYSVHNWNKGFPWLSVYDSLLRHLNAWHKGEDIDPESGELHLAHAGCNLLMLIDFYKHNIGLDDRWRYNECSD